MLTQAEASDLIGRVLHLCSSADGAEVSLLGGELALTRFANSAIHQNVAEERVLLSVRTIVGKRTARVTTSRLDRQGLEQAVQEALAATRGARESDDLLPLFSDTGPPPTADDAGAAPDDPERRAEQFAAARDVLAGTGALLFGYASAQRGWIGDYDEVGAFALGNSTGLLRFAAPAHHALSLTVGLGGFTAWAHEEAPADTPIEAAPLARRALEKAQRLAKGVTSIEPTEMTVILEPAAAAELVGMLAGHITGRAVLEERSCLAGKLGERVFGAEVTIADDVHHPLQRGVAFDAEGVPRRPVTVIERGVFKGLVLDRATAARMGQAPTGHGLPVPSTEGAQAAHLVMAGGQVGPEAMIASTARGVLITRAWYTNFVDFRRGLITGVTRDGTFLIEDGAITTGLRDLRFNVSLFDLLSNIEMLGPQGRAGGVVAPAMKVRGFRFTS